MPLIDIHCKSCDRVEEVHRPLSIWPKTPPCSKCEGETEQIHLPSHMRTSQVDPVVVYEAPDGTFRFPPDINSSSCKMYEDLGYKRTEARGFAEVRKLESRLTAQQRSEINRRVELKQADFERTESARRSEIRRTMEQGFDLPLYDKEGRHVGYQKVRLSEQGKDLMRAVIERNDRKGGPKSYDPGVRVEAYSENRSNRDRDPFRRSQ